jgi:hypothetical protein
VGTVGRVPSESARAGLLLCMARPELLDRRPGWAGGKLNATSVLLEPLATDETDLLIDELLAGQGVDKTLRTRIREAAEGNPFFCEQMVALLQTSEGSDVVVPPTIQATSARGPLSGPASEGVGLLA